MKGAALLIIAGVFVAAQILKGGALDRLLSPARASSGGGTNAGTIPPAVTPTATSPGQSTVQPGQLNPLAKYSGFYNFP